MKDFKNKYKFDIEFQKTEENKINISPEYKEELANFSEGEPVVKLINESDLTIPKEKFSEIDKYKIKIENMSDYQRLIKRIEINKKLIRLFIDNYYLDEFNNTRRGFYFCFSIPFVTFFGFLIMNPFNPLRKISFLISLFGTTVFTAISYKNEMDLLSTKSISLGTKVF